VRALAVLLGGPRRFGIPLPWLTGLTVLLPYLFDVILTLARRARRRERLWQAHREHLYQRLLRTGLSHAQVLKMNLWRFGVCGALALAGHLWAGGWRWVAFAAALGVMLHYWRVVLARERAALAAAGAPAASIS
jgi:hypothetical protein